MKYATLSLEKADDWQKLWNWSEFLLKERCTAPWACRFWKESTVELIEIVSRRWSPKSILQPDIRTERHLLLTLPIFLSLFYALSYYYCFAFSNKEWRGAQLIIAYVKGEKGLGIVRVRRIGYSRNDAANLHTTVLQQVWRYRLKQEKELLYHPTENELSSWSKNELLFLYRKIIERSNSKTWKILRFSCLWWLWA